MYYVGRPKGSIYLVNERLDLRYATNSLANRRAGVLPGDPYLWGGRNTEHETIYHKEYIYIYICI